MSILRYFGLIVSLFLFLSIFISFRKFSKPSSQNLFIFLFALFLFVLSLYPEILNRPIAFFNLNNKLIFLLIFSNLFSWLFVFYQRSKEIKNNAQIKLITHFLNLKNVKNFSNKNKKKNILILIPSYNEESNLKLLLPEIPSKILNQGVDVLVIDDGSVDKTEKVCKTNNTIYIKNIFNIGGGYATNLGFLYAVKQKYKYFVTIDADGQHNPNEISKMISKLQKKKIDIVIGSRILGSMENYSKLRYVGVIFFGKFISILLGKKVTDPASGFRAGNVEALKKLNFVQDQYHTAEFLIKAHKMNFKIDEIPIRISRRISGMSKKGKNLKYSFLFLKTILKTFFSNEK